MKRRILGLLIAICMVMPFIGQLSTEKVFAAEIVDSGTCGKNVTWTLDSDGLLVISGEGEMADYSWDSSPFNYHYNIKSVEIEDGITSIGSSAFSNCSSLTSIMLPDSVMSIGESAFSYCFSLTSITIPDSVTSIGEYAFSSCSGLTSIIVSEGNTTFDSRDGCNAIIETATNTLIAGCCNTYIPDSVTSIESRAFERCISLTSIAIPGSVTSIGGCAFYACGLASITIPDSVTSIGDHAFIFCSDLASITIPDSVTSIGGNAFEFCNNLTDIYYGGTEAQWNNLGVELSDTVTVHYSSAEGDSMLGDVNGSGDVTAEDLTALARHVAKIEIITDTSLLKAADVTGDGNVTADDLTKLARFVAKIITTLE